MRPVYKVRDMFITDNHQDNTIFVDNDDSRGKIPQHCQYRNKLCNTFCIHCHVIRKNDKIQVHTCNQILVTTQEELDELNLKSV